MILLFTDFGLSGPYVGQVKAVLARLARTVPVIDLMHDAPRCAPRPAAYLLAALAPAMLPGTVVLGVVDPGVGTDRDPIAVNADGRWFVGPDNGLFEVVLRRGEVSAAWRITWQPEVLSSSFHARDLFAPVAARLSVRGPVPGTVIPLSRVRRLDWADDLAEIIHIDAFGNAFTGLRAALLPGAGQIEVGNRRLSRADTFGSVPAGTPFWYENSSGLAEIAVNRGSAAAMLGLAIGDPVTIVPGTGA